MTNGVGTKHTPKDFRFENLLRQRFNDEKFEKIIYYDTCIIAKEGKSYGKIIICDDSIYSFVEALNKFNIEALYKDIYSIEMINDIPKFIFGPMRSKTIHIHIKFFKYVSEVTEMPMALPACCMTSTQRKTSNSARQSNRSPSDDGAGDENNRTRTNESSKDNVRLTSTREQIKKTECSIDFYILNLYSPALHLLKKARIDYLIYETLSSSATAISTNLCISHTLVNRLFDDLVLDMTKSQTSMALLKNYLLELIESGLKYHRIKVLFWSKPDLFEFMVTQFRSRWILLSEVQRTAESSPQTATNFVHSCLSDLNLLLQVFNTFLIETDHLPMKSQQFHIHNGKVPLSLIESDLSLIAYFNDCDQNNDPEIESPSDLDMGIDCLKHSITISSIQLCYHMLCSSQINVEMRDDDFSSQTIVSLLESLITFDSSTGIFNRFVNQALRMIFIWIFPKMFKFEQKPLDPERMIAIFQFFSSLRIIAKCSPKFNKFFRNEMSEEFEHFVLNDLTFPQEFPISPFTIKLLKSFQKNMLGTQDIFIDHY